MEALNSTAVNVSWTPVTLLDTEYHYTVHYTTMCCSFNVSFPASASSGVVSGLQEGLQYQFSVALAIDLNEVFYTGGKLIVVYLAQLNSFITFLETSTASISLISSVLHVPVLPTSVLTALIVVGVMLVVSLIGNFITTACILLIKRRCTPAR